MSEHTKIEWTDHTFNPWIGCSKVSPGCANCYAAAQDAFRKWTPEGWGPGKPRRRTKTWGEPIRWQTKWASLRNTRSPRVFCASLADWLDHEVPVKWRHDLLDLIDSTPCLVWQLLTKRPEQWRPALEACAANGSALAARWLAGEPPANVWVGTTTEDQQRVDERVPVLLTIPARIRFLSCEPLLGAINLRLPQTPSGPRPQTQDPRPEIHWVICGGESGPGARPMHPEWARSLRVECELAGVAFFFKQWGDWLPHFQEPADRGQRAGGPVARAVHEFDDGLGVKSYRVGKVCAGRLLDGLEHSEFPAEVAV